jgi:hypothetical protein
MVVKEGYAQVLHPRWTRLVTFDPVQGLYSYVRLCDCALDCATIRSKSLLMMANETHF